MFLVLFSLASTAFWMNTKGEELAQVQIELIEI